METLEKKLTVCAAEYYTGEEEFDRNIRLKLHHSLRVRDEARRILYGEAVAEDAETILAAALLHDCGRFEQFKRFRTYSDAESLDHGDLSARIAEERFLKTYDDGTRAAILGAIRCHNKLAVPDTLGGRARFAAFVVRDADKSDILPILIGHLRNPENPSIVFSLDRRAGVTPEIADALLARRIPPHEDMKTALDFLAAKFNWVYDIHFAATHRLWLERGTLAEFRSLLPASLLIDTLFANALDYQRQSAKGVQSA